jgi:exopolyphosphatase/pppGpp-phosphohydrolase
MSWFSSIFTFPPPHDARPRPHEKRLLEEESPQASELVRGRQRPSEPDVNPHRNKVVFGAGVAFFALAMLITRRSFARKRLQAHPAFYTDAPTNVARQAAKTSGPMEAMEALNIATVNVLSVALMASGAAMWYMDINSMSDARRALRGGLGVDGTGRDEMQAEEEFEEWMATVLSRRDSKEKNKDDASSTKRVNERGQER